MRRVVPFSLILWQSGCEESPAESPDCVIKVQKSEEKCRKDSFILTRNPGKSPMVGEPPVLKLRIGRMLRKVAERGEKGGLGLFYLRVEVDNNGYFRHFCSF